MNLLPSLPDVGHVLSLTSPAKLARGIGTSFADVFRSATEAAPVAAPVPPAANTTGTSSGRVAAQQQLAASVATSIGKSASLDELRSQAERSLDEWEQTFSQRLADAGVDLDQGFSLSVRPSDGRIVVAGDHPDKAKIEALLADDDALSQSIRSINTTLELVQAADQHRDFASAYEDDPVSAVANFRHLFESTTTVGINYWIDHYGARASLL